MRTRVPENVMRSAPITFVLCSLSCSACQDPSSAAPGLDGAGGSTAMAESGESSGSDEAPGESGDTGTLPGDLPTDGFLGGFFPVGVFGQPAYAMEGWADIGCNTMLSVPQGDDIAAWDQEAQRLGLKVIRQPLPGLADDIGRTDLLAWMLPDEPDVEANNGPCGGNCLSLVESLSSQWRQADPSRKIFVNVAGPNVLLPSNCDYCNGPGDDPPSPSCFPDNDRCYPRIIEATDWVSQDIYPVTGWLPTEQLRDDVTVVGQTLDRLRDWTDKPLFAIVEVSNQRLGFGGTGLRGPTAAEYRAEVWHAIIHGARGIFYFPQAFNPFDFEAVEPAVLTEMAAQHELLEDVAPLLQAAADPDTLEVTADPPLEVTWRVTDSEAWLFVLETSGNAGTGRVRIGNIEGEARVHGESRTTKIEAGALTDDFQPHALHIYVLRRD
jgi:hypothetical protein